MAETSRQDVAQSQPISPIKYNQLRGYAPNKSFMCQIESHNGYLISACVNCNLRGEGVALARLMTGVRLGRVLRLEARTSRDECDRQGE